MSLEDGGGGNSGIDLLFL